MNASVLLLAMTHTVLISGFGIGDGKTHVYAEVAPSLEGSRAQELVQRRGKLQLAPGQVGWIPLA